MTKISFNNLGHLLPVNSKNGSFFFCFGFFWNRLKDSDQKMHLECCGLAAGSYEAMKQKV